MSNIPDSYRVFSRADLQSAGATWRTIAGEVAAGRIVRAMRNRYLIPTSPAAVLCAVRTGGRVGCVSALVAHGVFVHERRDSQPHVHVDAHATRLRRPPSERSVIHWRSLVRAPTVDDARVHIIDALIDACLCQRPRAAIASLDSALHLGLIAHDDLDEIFRHLPVRLRALRPLVDARAESGPETFLRLMLRSAGVSYECQVEIEGVGRVDFLLDGWLIVECDSRAHHAGWDAQQTDRARDLAAAARGFATLRPVAAQILTDAPVVMAAILGLLARG